MDAKTILTVLKTQDAAFTLEHAQAVAAYAQERGLTPFTEFYAMLQRGRLVFKDHYSSVGRWAQQQGGYRKSKTVERRANGDIVCMVAIVTNRDYAAALQAAATLPGQVVLKDELIAYTHTGEAVITAAEMGKRQPPTGRTWEWLAERRATESVLLEVFGREPSRSREMYTAALTVEHSREAANALYAPRPQEALPAPVIEAEYTTPDEPQFDAEADAAMVAGLEAQAHAELTVETDEAFINAVEIVVCDVKAGGKPHLGFCAANEKWPSVKWWKGRDAFIAAAPWVGTIATREQLGLMDTRYSCQMRVYYEESKGYKNAVRFEQIAEGGDY